MTTAERDALIERAMERLNRLRAREDSEVKERETLRKVAAEGVVIQTRGR